MRRIALALCAGALLAAAAVVPSSDAGCGCWSSAFSPVWRPDGSSILYSLSTSSDGQSLQEAPVTRTKPTLVRGGSSRKYDGYGVWSPDASRLAFWSNAWTDTPAGVWVADGDGANAGLLSGPVAAATEHDELLSWLPDGRRLVFAAADGSVRVVDVVSGEQVRLAAGTKPLASPDGRLVAFQRDGALWLVGPDGNGERRLTTPAKGQLDELGSWAPDGRRLAFSRQVANPGATYPSGAHAFAVVVADVATGATTTVADDGSEPAWSPDGRRIAYAAEGIAVVPADGGQRQLLTDHFYRDSSPAWSPDGRTIAFSGPDVNGAEIFLVASEGGDLHNLTGSCPVTPVEPFGYLCTAVRQICPRRHRDAAVRGPRLQPTRAEEAVDVAVPVLRAERRGSRRRRAGAREHGACAARARQPTARAACARRNGPLRNDDRRARGDTAPASAPSEADLGADRRARHERQGARHGHPAAPAGDDSGVVGQAANDRRMVSDCSVSSTVSKPASRKIPTSG